MANEDRIGTSVRISWYQSNIGGIIRYYLTKIIAETFAFLNYFVKHTHSLSKPAQPKLLLSKEDKEIKYFSIYIPQFAILSGIANCGVLFFNVFSFTNIGLNVQEGATRNLSVLQIL